MQAGPLADFQARALAQACRKMVQQDAGRLVSLLTQAFPAPVSRASTHTPFQKLTHSGAAVFLSGSLAVAGMILDAVKRRGRGGAYWRAVCCAEHPFWTTVTTDTPSATAQRQGCSQSSSQFPASALNKPSSSPSLNKLSSSSSSSRSRSGSSSFTASALNKPSSSSSSLNKLSS